MTLKNCDDENKINLLNDTNPKKESLKLTSMYLIIGTAWIYFSDRVVLLFTDNPRTIYLISLYKGWFYIFITAFIFYYVIKNQFEKYTIALRNNLNAYDEISNLTVKLDKLKKDYNIYEDKLKDMQQFFDLSIKGSENGIWRWDIRDNKYYTSILTKPQFGYSEEYQNQVNTIEKWREHIHKDDLKYSIERFEKVLNSGDEIYENALRVRTRSGDYRWIVTSGKILRDDSGKPIAIGGSHLDITEKLQLEEDYRKQENYLNVLLNDISLIVINCDIEGKIQSINKFAQKFLGYDEFELIGKDIRYLIPDEENKRAVEQFIPLILEGVTIKDTETELLTKENVKKTVLWSNTYSYDEYGKISDIILIGSDITQRKEMEKQLYNLAYYDQLTGLPNVYKLQKDIHKFIEKAIHDDLEIVFVYSDIDDFNIINEIYGHSEGDKLLVDISKKITALFPFENYIYRFGGDEYVIILLLNSKERKNKLEDKINEVLKYSNEAHSMLHREYNISFSAGVAFYPMQGRDYEDLLKKADLALNHAKKYGKGRTVVYFDELDLKIKETVQLNEDLKLAINRNEFFLLYQPQIDLKTMKIFGAEALIRWKRPRYGIESPLYFIPHAEKTGDIIKIDCWVIEEALKEINQLSSIGLNDIKISINISGNLISNLEELKSIISCLSSKYEFKNTCFEITETSLIENLESSYEAIETIKNVDGKVALDDFGVGYSSLSYLQVLSIDLLKIDKSFVELIDKNIEDRKIMEMIVRLSHELGMEVLAEGIETKEQLEQIKEIGCDYAQGYYFYKPMPKEEFEELMRKQLNIY
ncbi:MAG: EAL domain-containing protein [Tissierellales bacterium]|nr:EAL domain-containing protein [Tissierellales bacterium]